MRTIVLADHLGMDRLTKAFGMVALFQGIAFMTNAPLAGKYFLFLWVNLDCFSILFVYDHLSVRLCDRFIFHLSVRPSIRLATFEHLSD